MDAAERQLLDHLDHPVFVLEPDATGRPCYAHVNRLALKMIGKPLDDFLGKTAIDIFPAPLGRASYDLQLRVMTTGEPEHFEVFKPSRGATSLVPLKDAGGRVLRVIGSVRPNRAPSLFRDHEAEEQARQDDLRAFVHLAAHDLRTPLNQVASLASMLRDDLQDPDQLELVDMLSDLSANALSLIGDVLTLPIFPARSKRSRPLT